MFKQAHSTRRTKRFHPLHRTMLGRFRILAYAALNEKDKEQSQTFHSFSVVQQGFESPATLRLKATSGLTSSWIKHRFDTTLWQNLEIHRCQNHLTISLCCFHHAVHACVRGSSARIPLPVLASGAKTFHICFMTSRQFNVMNGPLMLPTQTRQWQNVVTYIHSYLIEHS